MAQGRGKRSSLVVVDGHVAHPKTDPIKRPSAALNQHAGDGRTLVRAKTKSKTHQRVLSNVHVRSAVARLANPSPSSQLFESLRHSTAATANRTNRIQPSERGI